MLFPLVLSLYVARGSRVADVTYGKGVFWRNVPAGVYELFATDLKTNVDLRDLPYEDGEMHALVLDPPYMHSPGGTAHSGHQNFEEYYKNNLSTSRSKYHEAVLDLYFSGLQEANRVLQEEGIAIVKCQDEVCANVQRLTHVELVNFAESILGWVCQDLFVLHTNRRPGVSRIIAQRHARKRHSYFLVFRKQKGKSRWKGIPSTERWFPAGWTGRV